MKLETKTGVFVPLDDFNRMAKADLLTEMQDQIIVVLVHYELRMPMAVPPTTTMEQLAKCIMTLAKIKYPISTNMKSAEGEIYAAADTLKLRRIVNGTPLFCIPATPVTPELKS
jgi:hypothetical protein